jgi:Na+/H+-translocating membrane pyrophosphatase
MLIGAMLIYAFGSTVLFAIQNTAPVLCLDLKAQVEENSGVMDGTTEADMERSYFIFNLNTILQLKYFLPFVTIPSHSSTSPSFY